jgi:hypothetical protein
MAKKSAFCESYCEAKTQGSKFGSASTRRKHHCQCISGERKAVHSNTYGANSNGFADGGKLKGNISYPSGHHTHIRSQTQGHVQEKSYKLSEVERINSPTFGRVKSIAYEDWEPYVIVRRFEPDGRQLPRYPEEYIGRYKNKVDWVTTLRSQNYHFVQLYQEFLVHVPHKRITNLYHSSRSQPTAELIFPPRNAAALHNFMLQLHEMFINGLVVKTYNTNVAPLPESHSKPENVCLDLISSPAENSSVLEIIEESRTNVTNAMQRQGSWPDIGWSRDGGWMATCRLPFSKDPKRIGPPRRKDRHHHKTNTVLMSIIIVLGMLLCANIAFCFDDFWRNSSRDKARYSLATRLHASRISTQARVRVDSHPHFTKKDTYQGLAMGTYS